MRANVIQSNTIYKIINYGDVKGSCLINMEPSSGKVFGNVLAFSIYSHRWQGISAALTKDLRWIKVLENLYLRAHSITYENHGRTCN